ncbi:bifunctional MaoC family dehydratase N-terminal/OB-fold nucleic acid binding domain-containing protein [Acrocarpospora catenulata]|uniref:bifunctional MaoC family dehydratase N-terminal/OB-fold nucleic acid binding domain-containing protein n=1 Tax=Acrocarpospora catenulata TaxID=2836182 RepID=UPI0027E07919|nr:bifunctional MaoC family dehydratase N-terminal/OB-fold nucleic acid binding domain-containing protein [Acrocarpospora catenulata]
MTTLHELAERLIAKGEGPREPTREPVNTTMIRHWTQAMGDRNPRYQGLDAVAPPAMLQVWTMDRESPSRGPLDDMLDALTAAGYTGVVATNCEHTYARYLTPGEELTYATRMTELTGPKRTALGEGYFLTWLTTWYAKDEPVGEMTFRLLKFRPREESSPTGKRKPYPLKPAVNRDTAFFWEGASSGELRIQTCGDCGELRHPPGPICPSCRSTERSYVRAAGVGEIYSYVVHHNPPVPGHDTPFVVAVVEIPEGVRIVGNVVDCEPSQVGIGMRVKVTYRRMDDELILPMWAPLES